MREVITKYFYPFLLVCTVLALFHQTILHGLIPVPADTIIGLYHPYRDLYAADYPNGIPFKNFLITDPVRQIIPWKMLVMDSWRALELPLWNPYEMTGKPLLANFQSGAFYPLNILLIGKNFILGWTAFIMLQQILGAVFFYLYTRNLNLSRSASAFGALAFVFSGFFIAWLEWGNIIHTVLWLPLILLSIDKSSSWLLANSSWLKSKHSKKPSVTNYKLIVLWSLILSYSLSFSLFAGHLQTHFYVVAFSLLYLLARAIQAKNLKLLLFFFIPYTLYLLLTAIQWIPTLQFILLSARQTDQLYSQQEGWFIPIQHLIQFVAPDFFGNPTTLNYWGTWNYGELVGYVGIVPLLFAGIAVIFYKSKRTIFFTVTLLMSLLFATDNMIARLPYMLEIPLLSTAQPTRLLFISTFSFSVLASFGLEYFTARLNKGRKTYYQFYTVLFLVGAILLALWVLVFFKVGWLGAQSLENWVVAQKNLILPTALFAAAVCSAFFAHVFSGNRSKLVVPLLFFGIAALDLLRFSDKFLPFTRPEYLFPNTQTISYLENQHDPFRVASLNSEVMPANFLTTYKLASVDGYDPLYTTWYGKYVSALERGEGETNTLIEFNRIVTPRRMNTDLMHLLNTRFILATSQSVPEYLEKVAEEGQTIVYQNSRALPRVFFVSQIHSYSTQEAELSALYSHDLTSEAVVGRDIQTQTFASGSARIIRYDTNRVDIQTNSDSEGYLVFTDAYYPTWSASINGKETEIYRTNYAFRGVIVPAGRHTVIFENKLFKF